MRLGSSFLTHDLRQKNSKNSWRYLLSKMDLYSESAVVAAVATENWEEPSCHRFNLKFSDESNVVN